MLRELIKKCAYWQAAYKTMTAADGAKTNSAYIQMVRADHALAVYIVEHQSDFDDGDDPDPTPDDPLKYIRGVKVWDGDRFANKE